MTLPERSGVKVRGSAVKPSIEFIRSRFGEQRAAEVAASVSPGAARLFTEAVVAAGWYDIEDFDEMMNAAAARLAGGDLGLIDEMAAFCSGDAVQGIYRLVFKIASTRTMIENSPLIWKRYYSAGTMQVLAATRTSATIRLLGFPYSSPSFCRRVSGWMKATIELTGGKRPNFAHLVCQSDGGPWCEWRATWE